MKYSRTLQSTERFYFPKDIFYRNCNEGWLVVAVSTANWLVITGFQKQILEHLIEGMSIGEILPLITGGQQQKEFQQLLAAITAREFGNTKAAPSPIMTDVTQQITCYLTNSCNLCCDHCFMHSGKPLTKELSKEEWLRLLTDFHLKGGQNVTFTGGEPLMHRDFESILKHAHKLGLTTTVLSNGTLWTEKTISRLSPFISEIQISIDGFDELSNAKVRGTGHFDDVVTNIIRFANTGIRTSVATTFTLKNLQQDAGHQYRCMVEDIKAQSRYPIFFKLSKKILQGRNTNYTEEENRTYYNRIMEIEYAVDPNARYNNFMEGHTPNSITKNCGFGGISIGADGKVYYCNRLSEVESYGNINELPIESFIEQGKWLNNSTSVENLYPCNTCHLRYICYGGCRIEECNFHGKLKSHRGPMKQIKCSQETISQLEQRMIDSYLYYYKF